MKPNELYALQPIEVDYDFDNLSSALLSTYTKDGRDYTFKAVLEQINSEGYELKNEISEEKRIETRFYMKEGDGDKWGGNLYSVYFDNQPLMVVKNDGRYYSDYDTYITDLELFSKLEEYIQSKINLVIDNNPSSYNPDEDITNLETVSSYNLNDHYKADLVPQYKEGDVVWAWVEENHLKYSFSDTCKGYVLTKVEIGKVYPFKPLETYYGSQIERGWKSYDSSREMVLNASSNGIGCSFNDNLIVGKVDEIPMPTLAINNFVNEKGELPSDYKMDAPKEKTRKLGLN